MSFRTESHLLSIPSLLCTSPFRRSSRKFLQERVKVTNQTQKKIEGHRLIEEPVLGKRIYGLPLREGFRILQRGEIRNKKTGGGMGSRSVGFPSSGSSLRHSPVPEPKPRICRTQTRLGPWRSTRRTVQLLRIRVEGIDVNLWYKHGGRVLITFVFILV